MIDRKVRLPLGDNSPTARLIYGLDVREGLRMLPSASVHTICTSPPYWGLRDYGVAPLIWGGEANCAHVWGAELPHGRRGNRGVSGTGGNLHPSLDESGQGAGAGTGGQFCQQCGAWQGQLGQEPTPDMFVEHIVEVFREAKRVLRSDGTLWINFGDSVTHDTPILVRQHGAVCSTTVGSLCDLHFSQAAEHVVRQPDGTEILYFEDGLEVLSVNGIRQTGRGVRETDGGVVGDVQWRSVSALIRKPSRKTIVASKVASRTIRTTTDHAFILPNGKSCPPRVGLRVLSVNGFQTEAKTVDHVTIPAESMTAFFVDSDRISNFLQQDRVDLIRVAKMCGKPSSTAREWQVAGRLGVPVALQINLLDGTEVYTSKTHPKVRVPAHLPLDAVLLRFLGLWVGDGSYGPCTVEVSAGQTGAAADILHEVATRFGANVSIAPDRVSLRIMSSVFKAAMQSLGFVGTSTTKAIPSWMFNLSQQQIGAFLSGYLFADGYRKNNRISFTTSSPRLFQDISNLFFLCGFDIRRVTIPPQRGGYASNQESYVGSLRSAQTSNWLSQFGWCGVPTQGAETNRVVRGLSRATIRECVTSDYDHPYVYDISVPGTENFICDGIVLHNSYAGGGRNSGNSLENTSAKQQTQIHSMDLGPMPVPEGLKPKDLVGIPWRVALALQADGWYLRSDIIWEKKNPMPESVGDRPTKAHEYIFLLAHPDSRGKYFYDNEAVREPCSPASLKDFHGRTVMQNKTDHGGTRPDLGNKSREAYMRPDKTRNRRSVWSINTRPYKGAHFATWPPDLVEIMIKAGTSEHGVCAACGAPWERMVETSGGRDWRNEPVKAKGIPGERNGEGGNKRGQSSAPLNHTKTRMEVGWKPTCDCVAGRTFATVLDTFSGSATTGYVALRHGRHYVGLDLNADYLPLAEARLEGRDAPAEGETVEGSVLDLFGGDE